MEYAQIREWLDRHVKHFKEGNEINEFNSSIRAVTHDTDVLMGRGIELVADTMGLELHESMEEDSEYPYRYSFVYDGVKFMQMEKERLR